MRKFLLLICTILSIVSCNNNEDTPQPQPTPVPEPSQPTYNIGDLYDNNGVKGLIFKVNADGESGLIVSLVEAETMLAWSTDLVVTNATSRNSGAENCAKIMKIADWNSKYPAFAWCHSLGEGWYLPSVNELKELLLICSGNTFKQAIVTNNAARFSDGKYLSSTEMDQYWAYYVDYATDIEKGNYKQYTYKVRAIHTF